MMTFEQIQKLIFEKRMQAQSATPQDYFDLLILPLSELQKQGTLELYLLKFHLDSVPFTQEEKQKLFVTLLEYIYDHAPSFNINREIQLLDVTGFIFSNKALGKLRQLLPQTHSQINISVEITDARENDIINFADFLNNMPQNFITSLLITDKSLKQINFNKLMGKLDGSKIQQYITLMNSNLMNTGIENILEIIRSVFTSRAPATYLSLSYNQLWQLNLADLKKIRELFSTIQGRRNTLTLWGNEPELQQESRNWDKEQAKIYLAKLLIHISLNEYVSPDSLGPLTVLSSEDYCEAFIEFIKTYPKFLISLTSYINKFPLNEQERQKVYFITLQNSKAEVLKTYEEYDILPKDQVIYLEITHASFYSEILQYLAEKLLTYRTEMVQIQIDLTYLSSPQLQNIVNFLNNMKISIQLFITEENLQKGNFTKTLDLIRSLRNPRIKFISLNNNQLILAGADNLLRLIKEIFSALSISIHQLQFCNNGLWKLTLSEIQLIKQEITKSKSKLPVFLWTSDDSDLKTAAQGFSEQQAQEYLVKFLQMEELTGEHFTAGYLPLPQLGAEFIFQKLKEIAKNSPSKMPKVLNYAISAALDTEHQLQLARLAMASACLIPTLSKLNINPHQQVGLYLANAPRALDLSAVHYFSCFNLYDAQHLGRPLIDAWKPFSVYVMDENLEASEEEHFVIMQQVIQGLAQACKDLWPKNTFYQKSLEYLIDFSYVDSYSLRKLLTMLDWFVWVTLLIIEKPPIKEIPELIFREILLLPDPETRYKLSHSLINYIYSNLKFVNIFKELIRLTGNYRWTAPVISVVRILAENPFIECDWQTLEDVDPVSLAELTLRKALIVSPLITKAKELLSKLTTGKFRAFYKEGNHFRTLTGALDSLANESTLRTDEKLTLIAGILENPDPRTHIEHWMLLQGVIALGEADILKTVSQKIAHEVNVTVFQRIFGIPTILGRHKFALLTYLGKLRQLPAAEAEITIPLLFQCIRQGTANVRYNTENNPHLHTIFEEHGEWYQDLRTRWIEGEQTNLEDFIKKYDIQDIPFAFDILTAEKFLKRKILEHKHLHEDPANYYPHITKYLAEETQKKPTVIEMLQKRLSENTSDSTKTIDQKRAQIELQLIKLLNPDIILKEKITLLYKVITYLKQIKEGENLQDDLKGIAEQLERSLKPKTKSLNTANWQIVDTDKDADLFMCGTDVLGSCQRVNGTPSLNKCLLGYVAGGEHRMLAIQNAQGVTVARTIMRLMWDTQNKRPVLFLEDYYPDSISNQFRIALNKFAIHRAEYLGLSLLSKEGELESVTYGHPISSLGSNAPFVYVDALHEIQTEGRFDIPNSQVLYTPYRQMRETIANTLRNANHDAKNPEKAVTSLIMDY